MKKIAKIISMVLALSITNSSLAYAKTNIDTVSITKDEVIENITSNEYILDSDKSEILSAVNSILDNVSSTRDNIYLQSDNYSSTFNESTGEVIHQYILEDGQIQTYTTNFYENINNLTNSRIISNQQNLASKNPRWIYEVERVYFSYFSRVCDTGYIAAKIKQPKVDAIRLFNSRNQELFGFYSNHLNAPSSIKTFYDKADATISKGNAITNYIGVSVAIALVAFFGGGPASTGAIGSFLQKYGLSGVSVIAVTNTYNDYSSNRRTSDRYFEYCRG